MLLAFSPSKTQTKFWEKKVLKSIKRVKNSLIHTPTDRPRLKRQLAFLFLNVTNFFPLKNPRQNFSSDQTKFRLRVEAQTKIFRLKRPPDEISSETKFGDEISSEGFCQSDAEASLLA